MANMLLHPFDPAINKPRPNPDGSHSTEISRTLQFPDGGWANVPSLWWGDGSTVRDFGSMSDDQLAEFSTRYEQETGKRFPRFTDLQSAETAAKSRSDAGGGTQGAMASSQLQRLEEGIRRAHAAGDDASVQALGKAYRAMQGEPSQAFDEAMQRGSEMSQSLKATDQRVKPPVDLGTATLATLRGARDIPIIGPMLGDLSDRAGAGIQALGGVPYDQALAGIQERGRQIDEAAPIARLAGGIGANIASLGGAATIPSAARALGFSGGVPTQMLNSGLSTLGLGTVDNMVRGQAPMEALQNAAGPSALAAAIPGATQLLRMGGRALNENVVRPIATAFNRDNEAIGRVSRAIGQDAAVAPAMSQVQQATARRAGAEVVNADRFGSATRALARTAANVSPEAKGILTGVVEDRFATQGNRAAGFVRQLMGGATDDLALQEGLRNAARQTNRRAYDAAYAAPGAQAIWTPEIRNLMQADPFRQAIREADTTAANAAAVSGQRAIRNPFVFTADGQATLRTLPGGGQALPNLEFWDIVQRNLRNQADVARGANNRLLADQIGQMRTQLLNTLDGAVPQFQQARRGAAGFFGAEDAIDAGRRAATSTRQNAEIGRAVQAMSQAEQKAFSVGFSSELIDRINATRDRVNVINTIFGSQESREKIAIALGPQRARELEAYVRVEQTLDLLRQAVSGNSTTAQQLIAAGVLGGAGGFFASGGNLQQGANWALLAGLARRGAQVMGKRVDEQVMRRVAEMLTSNDPAQVQRAIQNAALSRQHMEAIEALMTGLNITARGTVTGASAAMN